MKKLIVIVRAILFNQIFFLAIAVALFLQWQEQRRIDKNLEGINSGLYRILWQIDQDMPGK